MKLYIQVCSLMLVLLWGYYIPVWSADADTGRNFYRQYCASCHGQEGRGNGPVSRYLTVKVPDLTLLKQTHHGIYPLDQVMSVIDGRRIVRAHGNREMPVWGEIFKREEEKYPERTTLLKAKIIAEYVGTLQR
jgi:Cytochrome C oxidase, cbb3-type, subunit III